MKNIHELPYTLKETEEGFMIASGGIFIGKIFKKTHTEDFIKARPEKAKQFEDVARATAEFMIEAANSYNPDDTYVDLMKKSLILNSDGKLKVFTL